jgi:hypothetical protein
MFTRMNDFDQAARHAVKFAPRAVLRRTLPRLSADLRFARWLDSQSAPRPGEPDRRCDTIAEVTDATGASPPWAVVVELFTGPDADALDRLLEYLGRFRRELRHGPYGRDRYLFAGVLIFLTGQPAEERIDMTPPGEEDVCVKLAPACFCLAGKDAVALLDAIGENPQLRGLLPWAPLMRGGCEPALIARWRDLADGEADEARRRVMGSLALVFADLVGGLAAWRKALEGWDVNESTYLREIRSLEATKVTRDILLRVLGARFPGAVSESLVARLQAESNRGELDRWFDIATTAASIDEFQAKMSG